MKIPCLAFSSILLLSLAEPLRPDVVKNTTSNLQSKADSFKWINDLRLFKDALLARDWATVKSFFDFPVRDKGNDIWFLANPEKYVATHPDNLLPFTEKDFNENYSAVLGLDLRQTLEKLDFDQLSKTGKALSPSIEVIKGAKNQLKAEYNRTNKKLVLALATISPEFGRYTISYEFEVHDEMYLKFTQVHLDI